MTTSNTIKVSASLSCYPPLVEEEMPMTMQIVLRTTNDGMVLASDTKIRTMAKKDEDEGSVESRVRVRGLSNSTKVVLSKRHEVAIAFSGSDERSSDPAKGLADYLSEQGAIPEEPHDVVHLLEGWGSEFAQSKTPEQLTRCTLLVIIPHHPRCRAYKLLVDSNSHADMSYTYMVAGDENNPAIFWPEYLKCDEERYDLHATTKIAAYTILMAAKLNSPGVGGLEIWQYDGAWRSLQLSEIESIEASFAVSQASIREEFVGRSKFDSVLRSLINTKSRTFEDVVAQPKLRKDGALKRSTRKPAVSGA
jgi:hypothetical protein